MAFSIQVALVFLHSVHTCNTSLCALILFMNSPAALEITVSAHLLSGHCGLWPIIGCGYQALIAIWPDIQVASKPVFKGTTAEKQSDLSSFSVVKGAGAI